MDGCEQRNDGRAGLDVVLAAKNSVLLGGKRDRRNRRRQTERLAEHSVQVRKPGELVDGDRTRADNLVHLLLRSGVRGWVAQEVVKREREKARGRLVASDQESDHVVDNAIVLLRSAVTTAKAVSERSYRHLLSCLRINPSQHAVEQVLLVARMLLSRLDEG